MVFQSVRGSRSGYTAVKTLGTLCSLYKGQQEEGNKTLITALIKAERVIRGRRVASKADDYYELL